MIVRARLFFLPLFLVLTGCGEGVKSLFGSGDSAGRTNAQGQPAPVPLRWRVGRSD